MGFIGAVALDIGYVALRLDLQKYVSTPGVEAVEGVEIEEAEDEGEEDEEESEEKATAKAAGLRFS